VRLLYDGRSEEPSATHRFRLAIAYLPPEALRIEIYPPVGGARLIVTGDGSRFLALEPQEKRFETLDPAGGGLARLVGVPLDARAFMAVLSGGSPCPPDAAAGTPESCVTPAWRYERQAGDGRFSGDHGETILAVAWRSGKKGQNWPDEVRFSWPGRSVVVALELRQSPGNGAGLETSAFLTEAPPGFTPGAVLEGAEGAPALVPARPPSGESRP
jgi:hypothetical protein